MNHLLDETGDKFVLVTVKRLKVLHASMSELKKIRWRKTTRENKSRGKSEQGLTM